MQQYYGNYILFLEITFMKKLLYLLLLTPIIYLASCSKSGVTPQADTNIEETIVGKTWKLLDTDYGWFHLNSNNTYLTKDFLCDTLREYGTWELDENILIFKYIDGPIEYVERNTIIEYNDSIVKVQADTSANLDINLIFETTEAVIRGCMDSTFLNFNPNAQCSDTCINTPVYGCMDPNALNYNDNANIDDGSCCYVAGCMDPNALNYNANACQDDGTCCFIEGCMDSTSLNYAPNACLDNGSCCYVAGCMDNTSPNYDPNACIDDGFCLSIGDTYQGGIIFYFDGNGGGLIAAPSDQGQAEWGNDGNYGNNNIGAYGTAIGTGNDNTNLIVSANLSAWTNGNLIAAEVCADLTLGGYSDWFLPSIDELREMYLNIGPGNALGLGNIGNFVSNSCFHNSHWSSSEVSEWEAWLQCFSGSGILPYYNGDVGKTYLHNVRAVRAF